MKLVGILLAAGSSVRFGGDKLLTRLGEGAPDDLIGVVACRHLLAAIPEVIAVIRPGDAVLAAALAGAGARVVVCANAADGMGASLACGVRASAAARGWVVALADMPWLRPDTIAKVAEAVRTGALLVAPYHAGRRGHPVGFGKALQVELCALGADEGAKSVVAAHQSAMVRIEVDDPGALRDVDTPQDLGGLS